MSEEVKVVVTLTFPAYDEDDALHVIRSLQRGAVHDLYDYDFDVALAMIDGEMVKDRT